MKKLMWMSLAVMLVLIMALIGCAQSPTGALAAINAAPLAAQQIQPSATTPAPSASVTPQYGGVLRFISNEGTSGSLAIPEEMGGLTSLYMSPVLERLLQRDAAGNIIPQLATSYQWSVDNLTLTLPLRQGVKFSDGTNFNADAVIWNINTRIEAGVQGTSNIAAVRKLDDNTIAIDLKKYENTWFESFCGAGAGATVGVMLSPTTVQTKGKDALAANPVGIGTGPFVFKDFKVDEYLELARNENYWGKRPYLDGIKWQFIPDPVTAQLAFENKDGDMIWEISNSDQLRQALEPKGYTNIDFAPGLGWVLVPSSGNPNSPWANQKVREAAEYAIDKQGIVDSVMYGYSKVDNQICLTYQLPWDPNYQGRTYDPAKAKQLLTEAGYPNGFQTNLYVAEQLNGNWMPAIQANLKAVGIDATLQIVSTGKWIDMETNGWDEGLDMSPQGPGPFGQYIQRYWIRPAQPNWSSGLYWTTLYRPPELDALINTYLAESTTQGQLTAGQDIVHFMTDNAMAIQLWEGSYATFKQDYVHNTDFGYIDGMFRYTEAWMSK